MPLEFTCPHCQGRTLVDDEFLGRTGACFQCGKTVTVPLHPDEDPQAAALRRLRARRMWWSSILVVVAGILTAVVTAAIVVVFVWPLIGSAREAAYRGTCANNLRAISAALKAYHDRHGEYPPPYLVDAAGKPMHSWRVLILPELGEHELYRQYKFTEPWDGPTNFALQMRMPAVFGCPSDPSNVTRSDTSYVALVGSKTMFPATGKRKAADVRDGAADTLLVVECHESGIPWTAPRDASAASLALGVNGNQKLGVKSNHERGAHAATVAGGVEFLSDNMGPDALESLSTVAGGEAIDWQREPTLR
ncbi:MAG: DUF1559 domain-containing protein [Pirellulales bacterium]